MPPSSPTASPRADERSPARVTAEAARTQRVRRLRVVRGASVLSAAGYAGVAVAIGGTGYAGVGMAQLILAASVALAAAALAHRGRLEPAAWMATLTLAVTPVFQAALDAGLRDPAMILVSVAPLVGAMTSGRRLAHIAAGVGIVGACAMLLSHITGALVTPEFASASLVGYAFAASLVASGAGALAGGIYLQHTRLAVAEVERHAAWLDARLQSTESRYRAIVENLPVGMAQTDLDGRILVANRAFARMIGTRSPEHALSVNMREIYTEPAEREAFRAGVAREGLVQGFEAEWRALDGTRRRVRIDARGVFGPDGQIDHYEGVVEDVTAARSAADAVARSEARFRALVQRSHDVVVVLDRAARLTYVSPSVGRLLGRDAEALEGTLAFDLLHPDDLPHATALLERMLANPREARQAELRLRHDAGHYVFAEAVGASLFDDPAVGGIVLNVRDVSERKRAQAILVQAKRQAEEVARLKGAFLANMSHEIRTPLTAILGFSDILAEEITDVQQREFVDLITRSGRRLMDTLNSVLDLARLEAGRGELDCRPLRPSALVDETVRLMAPAAAERGLALEAAVEVPDAEAMLDEAALARVLHNLVGNALKFTEHGRVTLGVSSRPDGRVAVTVADSGIGIDAEFLPRLFGEFEQESTGVERSHEGAGLGLSISRHLVERMGGDIAVASTKGVGTVFTLTFDRVGGAPPRPKAPRPRLLVVDDSEHARQLAERLLGLHFDVEAVDSGAEALRALEARAPDAVLLDVHLGDNASSGENVLSALRAMPAVAGLPVVAVTAYGMPGDRSRLLAAGFDDYVAKPYTRDHLVGVLNRLLGCPDAVPAEPDAEEAGADAGPDAADAATAEAALGVG